MSYIQDAGRSEATEALAAWKTPLQPAPRQRSTTIAEEALRLLQGCIPPPRSPPKTCAAHRTKQEATVARYCIC